MSEKQIDKRVLADLREWLGVSVEKVSDDELWNKSGNVRDQLIFSYACKDLGAAINKQKESFKKQIDLAMLLISKSFIKK